MAVQDSEHVSIQRNFGKQNENDLKIFCTIISSLQIVTLLGNDKRYLVR